MHPQFVGGTIASDQTICYNTVPAAFTSSTPASGGGAFTYQWQSRVGAGAWGNIAGATGETYAVSSALTQTTDYRRAALSTTGCGIVYSNIITITIELPPTVDAGPNDTICYTSDFYDIPLASVTNSLNVQWSTPNGAGTFMPDDILDARYNIDILDKNSGKGSAILLVLSADGDGACSSETVTDTMELLIAPELLVAVGTPSPFTIGTGTKIDVTIQVEDRNFLQDLSYYLVSPDDSLVILKEAYDPLSYCNFGDDADLTFQKIPEPADTLELCPGGGGSVNLTGTFKATGNWNKLNGQDPANGIWKIALKDAADFKYKDILSPYDGQLTYASISFSDKNINGDTVTLFYDSGSNPIPILNTSNALIPVQTNFVVSLGLKTKCFGSCDATAVVTPAGGIGPYQIQWSDGLGTSDTIDLCAGNYSVTVTDAMGCSTFTDVEVTSPDKLEFTSLSHTDSMLCGGAGDAFVACKAKGGTGKLTYTLLPGNIPSEVADSGSFTGLSGGTYTLRVEDINGCFIDSTFYIFEPEALQLDSVSVDSIMCNGDANGSIRVYASGGKQPYTFWISPGTEVNNDGVFENLAAGDYTIRFTDANKCDTLNTSVISLTSPGMLNITMVTVENAVCHDSTGSLRLFVSGGTGPYETSVDGGTGFNPGLEVADLVPGTYNVVVRDKNQCTESYPTPVEIINPAPIAIDSFSVIDIAGCYGDTTGSFFIRATGGWDRFEYSLDGGLPSQTNQFNNLAGGGHIVNITDSLGCVLTIDTINIGQPDELIVQEIVVQPTGEQTGSITLQTSGGTPPYQYSIDDGLNLQDTNFFGGLDAGIYHIYVEDDNGCTYVNTVNLSAKLLLIQILDSKDVSCYGYNDGGFTVLILNGTSPYDVLITNYTSGETVRDITGYDQDVFADENFEAGSYNVQITDAGGQIFDSVFTFDQPSQIIPSITETYASCAQYVNDGSITVTSTGGTGNYTYSWSDDISITDSIRTGLAPASYGLTVTDESGCPVATDIIVGANHGTVSAYAGEDTTICARSLYQLQGEAPGSDSIRWYFDPESLVTGNDKSIYITNPVSLASTMSTSREVNLILTAYQNGCYGLDTVNIDVYPIYTLMLYITDDGGLTELDSLIYLSEGETYQFLALMNGESGQIPASRYNWIPSGGMQIDASGNGVITQADDLTYYSVIGYSIYDCPDTASVTVKLLREVKVYNGFTPNGDSYNDFWVIENAEGYGSKIEVRVFNRWGEMIFHSTGYDGDKAWDGTFKGKDLPIGTYYYIIDIKDGKTKPITGSVTLIR